MKKAWCQHFREDEQAQLTTMACILLAIVVITVAGYATVSLEIEAGNPERDPPLGPEFECVRITFIATFEETYLGGTMNVTDAFNTTRTLVAMAESQYNLAFSADILELNETAPGEFTVRFSIALHASYGSASSREVMVLRR